MNPKPKTGILAESLKGKFSRWEKGEKVIVYNGNDDTYMIERVKKPKNWLPIQHQLCAVPRAAVKIDE